ncbi:MAG TPA: hypothetical protein VFX98_19865, partial [Longimicrobiaceae bacterium]|nr:hypothetical protein [Longimicrobiaceae bacterium]
MKRIAVAAALAALPLALPLAAQAGHAHAHPAEEHSPELHAQLEEVRRATERYRDHAAAVRDGYRRFGQEAPLAGEHWYRPDLVGIPFDLRRPSTLMYATVGGRRELVGVAYTVYRVDGEPLPEGFSGGADTWHVHDVRRLALALSEDRPFLRWLVERRMDRGKLGHEGRPLLTMVHAWVWSDNPDGVFAHHNRALPYLRAGL